MEEDRGPIVRLISTILDTDENSIYALYDLNSSKIIKRGDKYYAFLKKVMRAFFLLKTVNLIENDMRGNFEIGRASLQFSLLVSAIETVGTPSDYRKVQQWFSKDYFENNKKDCYSKKDINKAFNDYYTRFGNKKSFRDVILNSESALSLLSQIIFSEAITFRTKDDSDEFIHVKDVKNPKEDFKILTTVRNEQETFLLRYIDKGAQKGFFLMSQKNSNNNKFIGLVDISGYRILLKDLGINPDIKLDDQIKKKLIRKTLDFIYDLRSGFYHSGILKLIRDPGIILLGEWKYNKQVFHPVLTDRFFRLFHEIAKKAIIDAWKSFLKD